MLWQGSARTATIQSAAFSPDGSMLVLVGGGPHYNSSYTLDDSPGVDIYDAGNGTWLRTLDAAYGARGSVRFSPDGRYLMVPTSFGGIALWRTADWQRYNTFGYANGTDAVFLPENRGVLEISTGVVWCAL
jgi:WD40 repeat protein